MVYGANVYKQNMGDKTIWVAESDSLRGCAGQGENIGDAISELEENERIWIETAREAGIAIPGRPATSIRQIRM